MGSDIGDSLRFFELLILERKTGEKPSSAQRILSPRQEGGLFERFVLGILTLRMRKQEGWISR